MMIAVEVDSGGEQVVGQSRRAGADLSVAQFVEGQRAAKIMPKRCGMQDQTGKVPVGCRIQAHSINPSRRLQGSPISERLSGRSDCDWSDNESR